MHAALGVDDCAIMWHRVVVVNSSSTGRQTELFDKTLFVFTYLSFRYQITSTVLDAHDKFDSNVSNTLRLLVAYALPITRSDY